MFGFPRRPASRPLSDSICRAIASEGSKSSIGDTSLLRMVELNGRYSDRKVTYIRIFDPAVAAQRSLDVRRFQDLDASKELIVRSGHVERDGTVILTRASAARIVGTPSRTQADRTVHADDAHIVRGGTGGSDHAGSVETSAAGGAR